MWLHAQGKNGNMNFTKAESYKYLVKILENRTWFARFISWLKPNRARRLMKSLIE